MISIAALIKGTQALIRTIDYEPNLTGSAGSGGERASWTKDEAWSGVDRGSSGERRRWSVGGRTRLPWVNLSVSTCRQIELSLTSSMYTLPCVRVTSSWCAVALCVKHQTLGREDPSKVRVSIEMWLNSSWKNRDCFHLNWSSRDEV